MCIYLRFSRRIIFWGIVICAVLAILLIMINAILGTHRTVKRIRCSSNIAQIQNAVIWFFEENGRLPTFSDEQGNELWSWRVCFPLIFNRNVELDPNLAWNTPKNLLAINSTPLSDYYEAFFTCPFFSPKDTTSTYVIVTGPGTFWTELNAGRIDNPNKYGNIVFLIETTEPRNFWAEPGDEISPEEVIRLYQSDPGLVGDSRQRFYSWNHFPKHFSTWSTMCDSFDKIKSVEELKRRLVIPVPVQCISPDLKTPGSEPYSGGKSDANHVDTNESLEKSTRKE